MSKTIRPRFNILERITNEEIEQWFAAQLLKHRAAHLPLHNITLNMQLFAGEKAPDPQYYVHAQDSCCCARTLDNALSALAAKVDSPALQAAKLRLKAKELEAKAAEYERMAADA